MKDITINEEQRLYVIPAGSGFSCLGFDVCERKIKALTNELFEKSGRIVEQSGKVGTVERYRDLQRIQTACNQYYASTGYRFKAELTPELIGLEGRRVEVVTEWDDTIRFWVGRSTGWMPCHLQISRRNSSGGPAVCGKLQSVKVVA